jgi:hypothetical protein
VVVIALLPNFLIENYYKMYRPQIYQQLQHMSLDKLNEEKSRIPGENQLIQISASRPQQDYDSAIMHQSKESSMRKQFGIDSTGASIAIGTSTEQEHEAIELSTTNNKRKPSIDNYRVPENAIKRDSPKVHDTEIIDKHLQQEL